MSVLIVEDDQKPRELYDHIFTVELPKDQYPIVERRYAFSYAHAAQELASSRIFHLVILDLCVPEHDGQPALEDVDWGMKILALCLARDDYPIPAVLVITGFAGRTQQSELRTQLKTGFSYGELLVKAGDAVAQEIKKAIDRISAYLDIGIHIKDGGGITWPTLSPREEDLLRRSVLEHGLCGVDVSWWSSDYRTPTGVQAQAKGWTKVLMGRYLLPKGKGASRVNFFKFAPRGGAEYVIQAAKILERKLNHIKVSSSNLGGSRMLLVTDKTGTSNDPPLPLNTFLGRPAREFEPHCHRIIKNVLEQLGALGDRIQAKCRVRDLLWEWHEEERINKMLSRYRRTHPPNILPTNPLETFAEPIGVLRDIRRSDRIVDVIQRECVHGDLNVTNVAIDLVDGVAHAYVFDASGNESRAAAFDLAMLEVTTLLHVPSDFPYSMIELCGSVLYNSSVLVPPSEADGFLGPDRAANTIRLIAGLRAAVASGDQALVYALAVFDQILIQVGGLQWSGNKISRFDEAVLLADLAAGWLRRIGAPLFESSSTGPSQPLDKDARTEEVAVSFFDGSEDSGRRR